MSTARKTPQDRKTPQKDLTEAAQTRFDDVEGADLIKPLKDIKGTDQVRMLAKLRAAIPDTKDGDADETDLNLDAFADAVDWMAEKFAIDVDDFEAWSGGEGGLGRTLRLAMAFMGELGKGISSNDS